MNKIAILACSVVSALGYVACGGEEDGGNSSNTGGSGGAGALDGGPTSTGGAPVGGSGGTPGGGSGGSPAATGGVPAGGAGGTPAGGTGGTPAGGTGGVPAGGAGGTPTSDAGSLPTGGDQLSVCQADGDCNTGLGCYTYGSFCSLECTGDGDCAGLTGATYTCYDGTANGDTSVCRVECQDANDTTSCPAGMSCVDVAQGGGSFRCAYDTTPNGTGAAFEICQSDADCGAGLSCAPSLGTGYCTQACQGDGDCTDQPSSGSISAMCTGINLCGLNCAGDAGSCPDGMECQTFGQGGGGISFCSYP